MTHDPIFERLMHRWSHDPEAAKVYFGKVVVSEPERAGCECFLVLLPPALAEHGRQALANHMAEVTRKAQKKAASAEFRRNRDDARKKAHDAEIHATIARLSGIARIRYLASLDIEARERFATRLERNTAIAMRRSALTSEKVRKHLGCTKTELNRWDADGRLPHLFSRKTSSADSTICRLWSQEQVAAAVDQVDTWREGDANRQTAPAQNAIERTELD
jgi:hypothetical protein